MTENQKKAIDRREKKTDVKISVMGVEVITDNRNSNLIAKVAFDTDKGRITYKPKVDKEEFRGGICIKSKVQCAIDDIPENIQKIAKEAMAKGKAVVIANYVKWETGDSEEEVSTYRYVQGENMMESWTIQKEEVVK